MSQLRTSLLLRRFVHNAPPTNPTPNQGDISKEIRQIRVGLEEADNVNKLYDVLMGFTFATAIPIVTYEWFKKRARAMKAKEEEN